MASAPDDRHKSESGATQPQQSVQGVGQGQQDVIRGPWRLLRLLPRDTRSIISRMLEIDPAKRATLEEMYQDPWIANAPICRQLDHGEVVLATGHAHVLEPGTADVPVKKA